MKRTRYCWLLLTAGWLLAGAGLAQEPPASPDFTDVFELWNECKPITLVVGHISPAVLDLTKERFQTLAESRLRVARLYSTTFEAKLPFLEVAIGVPFSEDRRSGAFVVYVSFYKYLHDDASDSAWYAETWATASYGNSGDADYILQTVSEQLDQFILEYLRVNETACR